MKKLVLVLAAAVASTAAMAEISVGTVNGLVTAKKGNDFFNVQQGMTLPDDVELIVPEGGSVEFSMPGCSTTMGPGTVTMSLAACQTIQAENARRGGAFFASNTNRNLLIGAGTLGALAYNVDRNRGNGNGNGNGGGNGGGATVVTPTTPGTPAVVTRPAPPRRPSRS